MASDGLERPTSSDREQQRKDNVESRRQSGLEPLPRDREGGPAEGASLRGEGAGDEEAQGEGRESGEGQEGQEGGEGREARRSRREGPEREE